METPPNTGLNKAPPADLPMKVLVADDIQTSREVLLHLVRSLGHTPIEAKSGEEALHLVESERPNVILLDLLMPGMDGFEVAQAIRQRISGIWLPVIVLSALQGDEHYAQALASGASDCLLKPVNPAILRAKLRQYQRVLSVQDRLSQMARRQHAINEHIADAIITLDAAGRICEANRCARELLSQTEDRDPTGMLLTSLLGLSVEHLLSHAEVNIGPITGDRKLFSVSHSQWSMGQQKFWTIALHDLSESRRIERMKDEFLATVSHELRTPLTSILGALGLMAAGAGGTLPEGARELAEVAKRNGDRLSHLIDDVLDLTKLEGNRMPMNMRTVDLVTLIREALSANSGYAQRGSVRLVFEDAGYACCIQVDPDRFSQIMANLLSNAIKHSPEGKAVTVVMKKIHNLAHVEVHDEGPGIDPEFKKHLFEKFSQADSSDRRLVGGTGLGLYISRILVEKMGGSIGAEAGVTGGSIFRVCFPCIKPTHPRPWVLCIAQDHQLLERMGDWLTELGDVEMVSNLAGAQSLLQQRGEPQALLANPQAQGPTDAFCMHLSQMLEPQRIILMSDAINATFASRHGIGWLSASASSRQEVLKLVREIGTIHNKGRGHGDL